VAGHRFPQEGKLLACNRRRAAMVCEGVPGLARARI
jgi:hypothetical protein